MVLKMDKLDKLVRELESRGLMWDVGLAGGMYEARVWQWPNVIGRYRPSFSEPAWVMLYTAMVDAGISMEDKVIIDEFAEAEKRRNESLIALTRKVGCSHATL